MQVIRWMPLAAVAVVAVTGLQGTGVAFEDVVRYAAYWAAAVVLPGLVVSRALIGVRRTIVEDLALATVTGVSLEILAGLLGVFTPLDEAVLFWWVPVLVAGAAVPSLRRRVLVRAPERMPLLWSAVLAGVAGLVLIQFDVLSFRLAPLPPGETVLFPDYWVQLSRLQELMKYDPPQVPQAAGESLHYHYFAQIQMASGVRLSGVLPEVVMLRLWPVPVALMGVGLAFSLGRQLTSSVSAGVVTAMLTFAIPLTEFLWPGVRTFAPTPLHFSSPSQLIGNAGLLASAIGIVQLLRRRPTLPWIAWLAIIVVAASGQKSTIVPLLLAGTVIAVLRAVRLRSWRVAGGLGLAGLALVALQLVVLRVTGSGSGGEVALFGVLHGNPLFEPLVPGRRALRALNEGWFLDSIDSPRSAVLAVLAALVLLAVNAVRIAGVFGLLRQRTRDDLASWWLAGAVVAGYGLTLAIDHIGLSEIYFAMAGGVLGTALTVTLLWGAMGRLPGSPRRLLAGGIVVGCAIALLVRTVVWVWERVGDYGALLRMLVPLAIVVAIAAAALAAGRMMRVRWSSDAVWVGVIAVLFGLLVPSATSTVVTTTIDWARPVAYPDATTPAVGVTNPRWLVLEDELQAMVWLRAHSDEDDVVATNSYCMPVTARPLCQTRGFWVSGLSGRRVVLEGWSFTEAAHARHGVGGRSYDRQPAPFPLRFRLNEAVFRESDQVALTELRQRFGLRWLVVVHRAGPVPTFPAGVVAERYRNGAMTIFEIG